MAFGPTEVTVRMTVLLHQHTRRSSESVEAREDIMIRERLIYASPTPMHSSDLVQARPTFGAFFFFPSILLLKKRGPRVVAIPKVAIVRPGVGGLDASEEFRSPQPLQG